MTKLLNKVKGSIETIKYYKEIKKEGNSVGYKIIICPVCGGLTLDSYDICPTCGWEQDTSKKVNIDFWGPANHNSIREARRQYLKFGEIFPYTCLLIENDVDKDINFAKLWEDKLLKPNNYIYKLDKFEIAALDIRIETHKREEKQEKEFMKNMR